MMRQLIILSVLCFCGLTGWSQHETIFGKAHVVGGFGAPLFEWGLNNDMSTGIGGGGGVVIDNFFFGGYGIANLDFEGLIEGDDIDQLDIAHGGFWLGLSVPTHKLVHLYTSARIGWGAVDIKLDDPQQDFEDVDKIFAVTPEIGLEVNLTRWFRAVGAVGYRWVDGTNEARGYTDDDFSGAVASLTLRFGWFGNYRR